MKNQITRLKPNRVARCIRGLSNVISTIILTGIMLAILLIASFVSFNIINAQLTSTEFEQAKSNMLLLDTTVQDVSLRPGAGGYVQFNTREGGLGLINQTADAISINATGGGTTKEVSFNGLIQFVYSGGHSASIAVDQSTGYTALRGDLSSACVNMSQCLGFLRLEQDNGARIKLDYDRARIVTAGLIDPTTNLVQISFIHLLKGNTAGSGTVNAQVQNIQTNIETWNFPSGELSITVQHTTQPENIIQNYSVNQTGAGAERTVVVFSEIQILVNVG